MDTKKDSWFFPRILMSCDWPTQIVHLLAYWDNENNNIKQLTEQAGKECTQWRENWTEI